MTHPADGLAGGRITEDTLENARDRLRERMAGFRRDQGWSQRRAATEAGLTQSGWRRLEAGLAEDPRLSTLLRIQSTFGLGSLEELFGDAPTRQLVTRANDD